LLEYGKENHLLEVKHFKFWLELQDPENQKEMMMKQSLTRFPTSVDLWIEQLVLCLKTGGDAVSQVS
jgi:hypothetical protein